MRSVRNQRNHTSCRISWSYPIIHLCCFVVRDQGGWFSVKTLPKGPEWWNTTCHETYLCTHAVLCKKLSPLKCISLSRETSPLKTEIFALRLWFNQLVFKPLSFERTTKAKILKRENWAFRYDEMVRECSFGVKPLWTTRVGQTILSRRRY